MTRLQCPFFPFTIIRPRVPIPHYRFPCVGLFWLSFQQVLYVLCTYLLHLLLYLGINAAQENLSNTGIQWEPLSLNARDDDFVVRS